LHREGCGVLDPGNCRRLAAFLCEAADWLDSTRTTNGLPSGIVVYAISDGHEHYKIGKAVDVSKRIKQLQTGNGRQLELAAYLPCPSEGIAYRVETAAKRSLADCQAVGEWFMCRGDYAVQALYEGADAVGLLERPVVLINDEEATDGR
jgi:hypothetical protein